MESSCRTGHQATIFCCFTIPSNVGRSTQRCGNVTTHLTCAGYQRQKAAHNPPLPPTVLQLFIHKNSLPCHPSRFPPYLHSLPGRGMLFTVIHIVLQLSIVRGVERKRWNFRKADWASFSAATKRSIPLIPVNIISVEESYQLFW